MTTRLGRQLKSDSSSESCVPPAPPPTCGEWNHDSDVCGKRCGCPGYEGVYCDTSNSHSHAHASDYTLQYCTDAPDYGCGTPEDTSTQHVVTFQCEGDATVHSETVWHGKVFTVTSADVGLGHNERWCMETEVSRLSLIHISEPTRPY